jgi:site-specific DNA-methyltransferase (adenine-specific)
MIHVGDSLNVMRTLDADSVDAVVTDPPYGLTFMGKAWDRGIPGVEYWTEALRVAKPGAHLVAFGGTRTYHRLATAIEDAGWEIRDCFVWAYGTGFPKSHDVSKAIDKAAGAAREVLGQKVCADGHIQNNATKRNRSGRYNFSLRDGIDPNQMDTVPATDDARRWSGWGTALKPAWEPAVIARKPFRGTVAANVLRHGTGAINVDGCRVPSYDGASTARSRAVVRDTVAPFGAGLAMGGNGSPLGRWPANLAHDGSPAALDLFPREAARFFYSAKASKADRGDGNTHPTVKPSDLMAYVCRLVTPPGGLVLDPFAGSGSTGVGALREGFRFVGIELSEDYAAIARARLVKP